jgi:ferredoxin-NADP reductase
MIKYKVIKAAYISPSVLSLKMEPIMRNNTLAFYPGQYAAISFKRFGRPTPMRCFSIAGAPNEDGLLEFGIRIQGDFTNASRDLRPGDRVDVMGPFGEFVIDQDTDDNVILLAGGIGITPFMSMINYAHDSNLKLPITLLYSCQSQNDVPFYNDIIELEKNNPYFKVAFFITEGETTKLQGSRVISGRIDENILSQVTNNQFNSFTHFICGPTGFINGMTSILVQNNVSSDRIVTEAFGQRIVKEKSHKLPSHETRFVYAMTGALLILGSLFITGVDLVRAVPRINKVENAQLLNNSNPTASSISNGSTQSTANPVSPPNNSSSGSGTSQPSPVNSSNPNINNSPGNITQTQTNNNKPVTSVS